jgi:hypothetical protein
VDTPFTATGSSLPYGIALQPLDGKIVLVGQYDSGSNPGNSALARYNTDGSLDTSF